MDDAAQEVDVLHAQRQQLAQAQPQRRLDHDQGAVPVGHGFGEGLNLGNGQRHHAGPLGARQLHPHHRGGGLSLSSTADANTDRSSPTRFRIVSGARWALRSVAHA